MSAPLDRARVGLCASCVHHRTIESDRGVRYHLCGRSKDDERYARYPRLPVRRCRGHEPVGRDREERTRGD